MLLSPFWNGLRRTVIDADSIANLNVLCLINDTTTTALGYGIAKADLPKTLVMSSLLMLAVSVAVVAFSKGQLTVKSTAYDCNFSERDIDYALEYFLKEFKKKYKIDVMSNLKATLKLRRNLSCSRLFLRLKTGYTPKKERTSLNLPTLFVSTLWKYLETLSRSATRKWASVKSLLHNSARRSRRYVSQATSTEEKYVPIDGKDKQSMIEKVATIHKWLEDQTDECEDWEEEGWVDLLCEFDLDQAEA